MNKKTALLFTAVCTAALLTGCGSKDIVRDYSKNMTLGAYTGLSLERQVTPVTDELVKEEIESQLSTLSEYTEITDRAAKMGDVVVVDFTGTIDGEEFEGSSAEDLELELGSNSFLDGFEEAIAGMKLNDTKSVEITFPTPYDGVLDGKTAVFSVTLKTIYEVTMPDYNDEYVSSISDYSTVAEYEAALKAQLEEEYTNDAQTMACEDALTMVIETSSFDKYPEDLVESCKQAVDAEIQTTLDDFGLTDISEIYGEDFDKDTYVTEVANERMVVYTIAAKEKLAVTDEEYQARLEEEAQYGEYSSAEEFEKSLTDTISFKYQILRDKVLDFLGKNNQFTDVSSEEYFSDMEDIEQLDDDAEAMSEYIAYGEEGSTETDIEDESVETVVD